MVVCESCGNPRTGDEQFCTRCGHPFGEPATARAAAATGPVRAAEWLRAQLGPRAAERPEPSVAEGVRGVGGFLIALGILVLAGDRYDSGDSNGAALAITLALLVAAVVALARAPEHFVTPAVVASGVAAIGVGYFIVAGSDDPSVSLGAFIGAAILAVLYLVGPRRGHTFHLLVLVGAGWLAAVSLVEGSLNPFAFESPDAGSAITDIGVISLLVGAVYLGLGWWTDRSGLRGMATPLLGVGSVALAAGVYAVAVDASEVGGGLMAVAAGAVICTVGAHLHRRGTLWGGLLVVAGGLFGVVTGIAPDDEVFAQALLLVAVGTVAVVAGIWLAEGRQLSVAILRGERPPPPPPSPPRPQI